MSRGVKIADVSGPGPAYSILKHLRDILTGSLPGALNTGGV